MLRLAISSWTLHRTLGKVWYEADGSGGVVNKNETPAHALPLLELPALVTQLGIPVLEICHFHFPSLDENYLAQLKSALESTNIELANILIDTGNLSSPDEVQRRADIELNKQWQRIAAQVGANGVRIDCGLEAPTSDALERSAAALQELADYGAELGLITTTENWRTTSLEAEHLLAIMDKVQRPLGLCVDFGNAAKTGRKYETLAALMPRGTSIHCKAEYIDNTINLEDLHKCLSLAFSSDFKGYTTLIYDGLGDERDNILQLKSHLDNFFEPYI